MRIIDYQKTIYNPILEEDTKGFIDEADLSYLKNSYTTGYVLKGMEFRPDLIANYYLGDPTKAWIITYINEFQDGIKDYVLGRKLKIPVGV